MGKRTDYDRIIKYKVKTKLITPMHVGASFGERNEVLIHPVDGLPFVQASSIAGAMRDYYENKYKDKVETLFGCTKDDSTSRIVFSDGRFEGEVHYEMRPRVSIDKKSGTTGKSMVSGSNVESGHKFDMECISKGATLGFDVYIKANDYNDEESILDVFSALDSGSITIGGQRSNGYGDVKVTSLLEKRFDLKKEEDRKAWLKEEELDEKDYVEKKDELKPVNGYAYRIILKGMTESGVLVKGYDNDGPGSDGKKATNIQDGLGNYIIPGSAIKGSVRSQIERIVSYKNFTEDAKIVIVKDIFGEAETDGKTGNVRVYDVTVEVPKREDIPLSNRIHIDKLTGGVMKSMLFREQRPYGNVKICIDVLEKNNSARSCGYIIFALRDLAANLYNLGGGYSIGNGMIKTDTIEILSGEKKAVIHVQEDRIQDETGIIDKCIKATQEV